MKTSVIEKLLIKLAGRGYYLVEDQVELELSPEWERVEDYLNGKMPNKLFRFRCYRSDCLALSRRLGVTENSIPVLLAMASSDYISVENLVSLTGMQELELRRALRKLEESGFIRLHVFLDGPEWKLTDSGIMSMISEAPIGEIDESAFVKGTEAYQKTVNLILKINDMAPVIVSQPDGAERSLSGGHAEPVLPANFFDRLVAAVKLCADDELAVVSIRSTVESVLPEDENSGAREALRSVGYDDLTDDEKTFLLLLCHQFYIKGTEPMRWSEKNNPFGRRSDDSLGYKQSAGALVAKGIALIALCDSSRNEDERAEGDGYILSPDVAAKIFAGMDGVLNCSLICRFADVIKASNIDRKPLYFPPEMEEEITRLEILIHPDTSAMLMERLGEVGRKSLTCLFYGAPGVGKTELARQLAAGTGRDLIIADVAKLTSSLVGETEKNVREIFRSFKYLAKISGRSPILLFNEADGILCKRFTEVSRYVEKSENAVQGIILQELETFEGIFIATTNLEMNLDGAVERRFLYKLKFERPPADVRVRMIRDKFRWLSEEDSRVIGEEFELTGGQMENVASKCVIEQFISGKVPSLREVRRFCRDEIENRVNGGRRNPIGFVYAGRK